MNKYYISICLLCKDENDYLNEWVTYHKNMGVDHFYIYDHQSKVSIRETLKNEIESGFVTVIDWDSKGIGTQPMAYSHCVSNFGHDNRWIAFIDTDEFIVIKESYENIKDFMKEFESYDGVGLNWLMFGSSYLEEQPESVLKNFKLSSEYNYGENVHIKTIVNPKTVIGFPTPHNVITQKNMIVNENFKHIPCTPFSTQSYNKAFINHYYTRSRAEFKRKVERGRGDQAGRREMSEFDDKIDSLNKIDQTENMKNWIRFI